MVKETESEVLAHVITKEEEHLIQQLKENVRNLLPENILSKSEEDQRLYLVRWIRARDLNLEKATEMLKKDLEWRIEKNADTALNVPPHPFFDEVFSWEYVGNDKKGRPVLCVPMSQWDVRKVVNDPDRLVEFDTFVTYLFESMMKILETQNGNRESNQPPATQFLMLVDVKDYPYGQIINLGAMKKLLQIASTYEAHYPEILFRGVYINCPVYFNLFMNLLKTVVAPKTMGKLKLYSNFSKWQEAIVDMVDPDIIPERYGGTLKDSNRDSPEITK